MSAEVCHSYFITEDLGLVTTFSHLMGRQSFTYTQRRCLRWLVCFPSPFIQRRRTIHQVLLQRFIQLAIQVRWKMQW